MSKSKKKPAKPDFTFELSLSVLDHLGRHLYRSFATVIGEAISNAWDADAKNVYIHIDKNANSFLIKDDGHGMSPHDFQTKFLKIGYSKRKKGSTHTKLGRPYIGRKGIGKLALLSCADRITIISRTTRTGYTGGTIDNTELDAAITEELTPQQYQLGPSETERFSEYMSGQQGTIIFFENIKDGIKQSLDTLRAIIALYFRFSLIDSSFSIYVNDDKITYKQLETLAHHTQFLWRINSIQDPYIRSLERRPELRAKKTLPTRPEVKGFIASVQKPRQLKVLGTGERVGVDLFVNGRLRERDLLSHIPTAQVPESYLYGQIHYNQLDDETDRFTSSREGIVADDPVFAAFLEEFRKDILLKIVDEWDKLRTDKGEEGDSDNPRLTGKERKSGELYKEVSKEFALDEDDPRREVVDDWIANLSADARFNFGSYAECFISENLSRKYIEEKKIDFAKQKSTIDDLIRQETESKGRGNLSINIRKSASPLSYLDMARLALLIEGSSTDKIKDASLVRDSASYKPVRDALAHTALLTEEAKRHLTSVFDNIRARVQELLAST